MRSQMRIFQEKGSLFSLLNLWKGFGAEKAVAMPIEGACELGESDKNDTNEADAELVKFLDQCIEAKEIQRLHHRTGEALARLVGGNFEVEPGRSVTPTDQESAAPGNLVALRPRVVNPFDSAASHIAEAMKKMTEGRQEADARINAITQRADQLASTVRSLHSDLAGCRKMISELEAKVAITEQRLQRSERKLIEAQNRILDSRANEAALKENVGSLRVRLGIAGVVIIGLAIALALVLVS